MSCSPVKYYINLFERVSSTYEYLSAWVIRQQGLSISTIHVPSKGCFLTLLVWSDIVNKIIKIYVDNGTSCQKMEEKMQKWNVSYIFSDYLQYEYQHNDSMTYSL